MQSIFTQIPTEIEIMNFDKIFTTIKEIYLIYFTNEINEIDIVEGSKKSLLNFSTDFEILPFIINETQCHTYFEISINYELPYFYIICTFI